MSSHMNVLQVLSLNVPVECFKFKSFEAIQSPSWNVKKLGAFHKLTRRYSNNCTVGYIPRIMMQSLWATSDKSMTEVSSKIFHGHHNQSETRLVNLIQT